MTRRGSATVDVAAGLPEVLACPWMAQHAVEFVPSDWGPNVQLTPGGGTVSLPGYDSGTLCLEGVGWFDERALLTAAPGAGWQAFLGYGTEQPGRWLACSPTHGLVEAQHVGLEVVIPRAWADPATRGPEADALVQQIDTVLDHLAHTAMARAQQMRTVMAHAERVGNLVPPAPRMATPAPVAATVGVLPFPAHRARGATR